MANTLSPQQVTRLTTGFTTQYTAPALTKATISLLHVVNTTGSTVTVRLCHVPNAGSALEANALLWDFDVSANAVVELMKGYMLAAGDTIQALAGAGSSLNLAISVVETT